MKRQIYMLFACNQWRTWESMRLKIATTNKSLLLKALKNQVKSGKMTMDKDIYSCEDWQEISDNLNYGYIMTVDNGEEL